MLAEVKPDNDQGEYYLTDVIGILNRRGARVEGVPVEDQREALGINDRIEGHGRLMLSLSNGAAVAAARG